MTTNNKVAFGSIIGLGAVALTAGGLLAVDTSAQFFNAQAEQGNNDNSESRRGPRGGQNRDALEAIQNRDYDAWVEAIQDTPRAEVLLETINESNFDRYVDMLEAKRDGNDEEAETIREELDLPSREELKEQFMAKNEAVQSALENADYAAWQAAVAETRRGDKMLEKVNTQEKFDLLVEMHSNKERNKEIAEELGLEFGKEGGRGPARQGKGPATRESAAS